MGLDTAAVTFLCAAKSLGVNFTRKATIGRQSFFPAVEALRRVFSILGIHNDAGEFLQENRFGEPFFSLLGANEISSLDYSSYEDANILHDMNLPIPDDLRERFSVVYDGGTLEHVFNIPQALKNCMEMVQVGGHFTQVTVANNFMGHGFWQFSPESIFRAFSPTNGYQIEAVLLHEVVPLGAWYLVTDPDKIHSRVELCNSSPIYILTVARRVAITEIFALPPQQSDYVALWGRSSNKQPPPAPNQVEASLIGVRSRRTEWRRYLPGPVKRVLKRTLERLSLLGDHGAQTLSWFHGDRGFNQAYFRRISEEALLRGKLT